MSFQISPNRILLTVLVVVYLCLDTNANPNFRGNLAPVFTPFDDNGNLNTYVVYEYASFLAQYNVSGVIVAAADGEGYTINLEERKRLLDAWISAAQPLGLTVIMTVGALPYRDVLELAGYSSSVGADAILVLPDMFYRPLNLDEGFAYFKSVADHVPDLPVFYYDDTLTDGVDLNMALFFNQSTSLISNFVGIRTLLTAALQVAAANTLNDNQVLLISNHDVMEAAFVLRFGTTVSIATNVFPELAVGMEQYVGQRRATEFMARMNDLVDAVVPNPEVVTVGPYVTGIKCAFEIVTGIRVGSPRPPFEPITENLKRDVTRILLNLGVRLANPTF